MSLVDLNIVPGFLYDTMYLGVETDDEHADKNHYTIPLEVTHRSPLKQIPLLVSDPSGTYPQEVLDVLMTDWVRRSFPSGMLWWQKYYMKRREDQAKYKDAIILADIMYRKSAPHPV